MAPLMPNLLNLTEGEAIALLREFLSEAAPVYMYPSQIPAYGWDEADHVGESGSSGGPYTYAFAPSVGGEGRVSYQTPAPGDPLDFSYSGILTIDLWGTTQAQWAANGWSYSSGRLVELGDWAADPLFDDPVPLGPPPDWTPAVPTPYEVVGPVALADAAVTEVTFDVTEVVEHVTELALVVDHDYVADLEVRLIAPDGTTKLLINNRRDRSNDSYGVKDDDGNLYPLLLRDDAPWRPFGEGTNVTREIALAGGIPEPFRALEFYGWWKPEASILTDFGVQDPGTWTLRFTDTSFDDAGTLLYAALAVNANPTMPDVTNLPEADAGDLIRALPLDPSWLVDVWGAVGSSYDDADHLGEPGYAATRGPNGTVAYQWPEQGEIIDLRNVQYYGLYFEIWGVDIDVADPPEVQTTVGLWGTDLDNSLWRTVEEPVPDAPPLNNEVGDVFEPHSFDPDPTLPGFDPATDLATIWRSGNHIARRKPRAVVEIQRGRWFRGYMRIPDSDVIDADIYGEEPTEPWMAYWQEAEPWRRVPNVSNIRGSKDFEQNGLVACEFTLENIDLRPVVGPDGTYHVRDRGFASPARGYAAPGRPPAPDPENAWRDAFARKSRVRIWIGYGDPVLDEDGLMPLDGGPNGRWVFAGQIEKIDTSAAPDRIHVSARTGAPLTDQRAFGWAKSKQLKDPVVFADRSINLELVGTDADASSSRDGSPASNVLDGDKDTAWRSDDHTTPGNTEWVEIRVPAGHYRAITLHPAYDGMDAYIGFYVHGDVLVKEPGGVWAIGAEGWQGDGPTVPGSNGGWEYLRLLEGISDDNKARSLGWEFQTTEECVIRVGFRNLKRISDDVYRAGVRTLKGRNVEVSDATKRFIYVDDVSDMVRVVLRWAGFTESGVEDTGVRIKGKRAYNRASFLVDIIKEACEATGFVFFVTRPTNGESHGIPVFRRRGSTLTPLLLPEVTDSDLLTGVQGADDNEPRSYIIRVRGKTSEAGQPLGGDPSDAELRIMDVYRPPWAYQLDEPHGPDRTAGIFKHVIEEFPHLQTIQECQVMARLIAYEEALVANRASIIIPGNPAIELNDQLGVQDQSTSTNSRLWITGFSWDFSPGRWFVTVQGALIDTEDVVAVLDDLKAVEA